MKHGSRPHSFFKPILCGSYFLVGCVYLIEQVNWMPNSRTKSKSLIQRIPMLSQTFGILILVELNPTCSYETIK